jgi:hypothetical protein
VSVGYVEPRSSVSFGDIFDLEFLHDVHVRGDAVALGSRAMKGGGETFSETFPNPKWVLAHGGSCRAILITDNCVVDTALGQDRAGGKAKGRLLFAPVSPIKESELPLRSFGRFALPTWDGEWAAGAAELRKCFMVDARDIAAHRDARKASLDLELAEELEVKWSAFASRRGPLTSARNAEKLAEVLSRLNSDLALSDDDIGVGYAVAQALSVSWRLEGKDLEAVADVHSVETSGVGEVEAVEAALRELADAATSAADQLRSRLPT